MYIRGFELVDNSDPSPQHARRMPMTLPGANPTAPLRIASAFVWVLAAWAVSVHLGVATGASFSTLLLVTPLTVTAAAAGWLLCCRNMSEEAAQDLRPASIGWFLAAGIVLVTWRLGYFPFWIAAILFLLTGWASVAFSNDSVSAPDVPIVADPKRDRLGLIGLCLLGVLFTLLVHHPNIDDGFYVSVAADAHRNPSRAIWSTDTMHDTTRFGVFLPIYKAEAYEYLIALAVRIFHVSSIRAASSVLPPIFAIFVVLSWATLVRTINPKNVLAVTAMAIAISVFAGEARLSPAAFAFVQLQEGKSIMSSAIVPLLCVFAWRLVTQGGWQNGVMLAVTQIAGIGLSSTAMVIGPPVVCAVGFACAPWRHRFTKQNAGSEVPRRAGPHLEDSGTLEYAKIPPENFKPLVSHLQNLFLRLTGIALSCVYPMSAALLMHGKMTSFTWIEQSEFRLPDDLIERVLGERQCYLFLAALLGAWTVSPRRSARLLLAPGILLLGLLLNPLTVVFFQTRIFSPLIFQRVFWVVPWLIWAAVFICGLSARIGCAVASKAPSFALPAAIVSSIVLLFGSLLMHPVWQHKHGSHVRFGALKVDDAEYAVATHVSAETPPGMAALAPESVACWTAVQDQRPPLIFVRPFYTQSTNDAAGLKDVEARNRLGEIAGKSKLTGNDVTFLSAGIHRYSLGSIVLQKNAGDEAAYALRKLGFESQTLGQYVLWIRRGKS